MRALPILVLACAAAACTPVRAQRGAPSPAPQDTASQEETFDELTKDAERFDGLFDLYAKEDKLYMVVPVSRLGHQFLMESKIARGVGAAGLYGGTMLNLFEADVITFERAGERVYLLNQPHRFNAEDDTPAGRAVDLSFSPSVIASAEIAATQGDSLLLIDIHDWVVSDLSGISERVRSAASDGPGERGSATFDEERSYLEQLHDREWARTRGLVSSVMDYHAPNIAARGQPQGFYYTPTVGSSDEWVIAYGYTPDAARAAEIAREAGRDGHAFGTDEDARRNGARPDGQPQ